MVDHVLERLAGGPDRLVDAVEQLPGDLERARTAHGAQHDRKVLLDRSGEGPEPGVLEVLAIVADGAGVEQRSHDLAGLDDPRQRLHPGRVDAVLGEHRDVAEADHDLGTAVGQLVEGRRHLRDMGRVAEDDVRDVGAHPDPSGLVGCGGEQEPHVLPPRLVDRVGGVEPALVRCLDDRDGLVERVCRDVAVAELRHLVPPTELDPIAGPLGRWNNSPWTFDMLLNLELLSRDSL